MPKDDPKTYWNYRVVKKKYLIGDETNYIYGIHEAYYEGDTPVNITKDPISVDSEDLKDLPQILNQMKEALSKPVLLYEDFCQDNE